MTSAWSHIQLNTLSYSNVVSNIWWCMKEPWRYL